MGSRPICFQCLFYNLMTHECSIQPTPTSIEIFRRIKVIVDNVQPILHTFFCSQNFDFLPQS